MRADGALAPVRQAYFHQTKRGIGITSSLAGKTGNGTAIGGPCDVVLVEIFGTPEIRERESAAAIGVGHDDSGLPGGRIQPDKRETMAVGRKTHGAAHLSQNAFWLTALHR